MLEYFSANMRPTEYIGAGGVVVCERTMARLD